MKQHLFRFVRMAAVAAVVGAVSLAAGSSAQASFLDDDAALGAAIAALRTAIGAHPRVLRIEIDADSIAIEAQDPRNRAHVDRWRYATVKFLPGLSPKRLSGPQPVELHLINPDLETNLFDLDAVDLAAAPRVMRDAVARARLEDAAAVTRIEIARQIFILPDPSSGDVRWTLTVASGREHAEIYADARGAIVGAELGSTRRAQTLDIVGEAALVGDAVAAFRRSVGAGAVLTEVRIAAKTVSFTTNIRDEGLARLGFSMPATASYTWDLNGLQRRLGRIDTDAMMGNAAPPPFSVDDVNWKVLAKLEQDALARAAVPQARIKHIALAKSTDQPGGAALVWTVEIVDPRGEVTSVVADAGGTIARVVLPASRRLKTDWLDAATIAGAIARIGPTFGADARIASIVFDARGGRVTLDDRANGSRPATFDFSPDSVPRATISFSLDAMGPRFAVADLAPLNAQLLAKLEAEGLRRLGAQRQAWLESVSVGGHPFVPQAGARAIEVRVRDVAVDSVQAHYAWIVFDFTGRMLDSSDF